MFWLILGVRAESCWLPAFVSTVLLQTLFAGSYRPTRVIFCSIF